ncbi:NAD-dependent epimerase/dehydratase family protein [Bacillus sp. ISL-40]|uniref:NAD-dependent epimerase/dehydratase family protein n=1 Tax=unclassified Bacillus (in: firmicutes) TaxID=185979 RepID=UPI001BECB0AA|nr:MULTISPECIES: NAD-dependent epimerase/dehydratase family protein [unclassified Bacillus (in: firmicutes)]MBT2701632.1 NAD-dependent epimerase/dehydratase family protein [Bacillus sp. ISL-40]MBT2744334.1 NAD-dependent epimerase/dehydratase family protein [Bacillus sp. ISL-77]
MKVLVTGGLGFIGSHLVDQYIHNGYEVVILDNLSTGSLSNLNPEARLINMSLLDNTLADCLHKEKPDIINHQAAQVNVRSSVSNPIYDVETNLLGTIRLLQAAGEVGIKKFIFASSGGTVYGETPEIALPETFKTKPVSPYGINKLASEFYVDFYAKQYGFQSIILRYSNVYGLRQNPASESGVVSIFANRLRNGLPPIVYGDGEQIRDYIHVSDVVAANILVSQLESQVQETFNVGTGKGTSLNDLLTLIYRLYRGAKPPVYTKAKTGELGFNVLSINKLSSLGWSPKINLKEGIQQLCQKHN